LLAIVLLTTNSFLNAQITVDTYGKVGLHSTTTSTSADVLILGSARIQNAYGGTVFFGSDYSYPQIWPGTTNTGYVGTPSNRFQYVYGYYLYYNGGYLGSDRKLKENIRTIDSPLSKILKIEGKKYDFIIDSTDNIGSEKERQKRIQMKKDRLGFIAQDMKDILPEVVSFNEEADQYYIEYTAIIPVIVEAMKEQQTKIETLEKEIVALKNESTEKSASIEERVIEQSACLNQNIPNPFTANTSIEIYLPSAVSRAALYIYNMQGEQIKQISVNERGKTAVKIEGHTLKAGMYLYTLIADGKEVDTKKMILTK
jgi:hypothetical protein